MHFGDHSDANPDNENIRINLGNFDEVCLPFKRFQNSLYMLRGLIIICLFTVLVVMVMRDLPAGAPVKLRRVITAFSVP